MGYRTLVAAAAVFTLTVSNASLADVVFQQNGVVVDMSKGITTLTVPGKAPRRVTGNMLPISQNLTTHYPQHHLLLAQADGGVSCPGGYWSVLDLVTATARPLAVSCNEAVQISVSGTPEKPVLVINDNGALKKMPVR